MADIVNLRRARKAKARDEAAAAAARNRRAFGRSKHEREIAAAGQALESRRFDGHLREEPPKAGDLGAGELDD